MGHHAIGFHHPHPFLHPTLPHHLQRLFVDNDTIIDDDNGNLEIKPNKSHSLDKSNNTFLKTPIPRVVTTTTTQSSQYFIGPQPQEDFIGPKLPTTNRTPLPVIHHSSPTPFTAFYQNSTPKNSIYQTSRDFNNNKNDWNEFYDITGVRGPHLPLTKDLDIRHDGDPRPNPIHRQSW